jgi:flagellar hook-length control protein FliK
MGWNDEVGNQIAWMANRQESHAELILNPPQMGRVEISLTVTGEQATASFVSGNPTVREALEAALPRLREVLAEAGIQLGQAQVGAENPRQSAQQEQKGDNSGNPRSAQPEIASARLTAGVLPAAGLKSGRGLVDVFA